MAVKREPVWRTLLVAAGVAVFCSLMVSASVIYLRPVQAAWAELERNRVLLELAGYIAPAEDVPDRIVASRFRELEVVTLDLAAGRRVDETSGEHAARVYVALRGGQPHRFVLPLSGQGMWAPIEAYLALEGDCSTVSGLAVFRHGETPGIGDRIEQPAWLASWAGLRALDADGRILLTVRGSGGLDPAQERAHTYDAITGATVTVTAVGRMVRHWLGDEGYGPFLARCRAGEAPWL